MDIARAKAILAILADGINPVTGEVMPPEDACNEPDVIRALHTVLNRLPDESPKLRRPNSGKPWDQEEEEKLLRGFENGMSIAAMAKDHGRTKGAIESRLARLGLYAIEDQYSSERKRDERNA